MDMPPALRAAIDALLTDENTRAAVTHAPALSLRYRERTRTGGGFVATREDALAYLLARMPATYGAVYKALSYTLSAAGDSDGIHTLTDIGAGTGAAAWAADTLLNLQEITCVESAPHMRQIGEGLMRNGSPVLRQARWKAADITANELINPVDLITAAYVLNELPPQQQTETALRLWQAANKILLLVEPGTPEGFGLLQAIRKTLVSEGACILAPCPRSPAGYGTQEPQRCPLPETDWCHFAVRVSRSRAHKQAKRGNVPYEDEKFAYIALGKQPANAAVARVLRHPVRRKGFYQLTLCTGAGVFHKTVARGDGSAYTAARKLQWGDGYEEG